MLNNDLVIARIEQQMPGIVRSHDMGLDGILNIHVDREQLVDLLRLLRDDEILRFNFLTSLCGIHHPGKNNQELGVIYHLHNWTDNLRIRVKIAFPKDDPHVPTITPLWATANWMERQEYDFFGIVFTAHPDLRRILNVDEMDVFPMRKEFKLEDGTRTDKDDRFFGRDGHYGVSFE